MKIFLDEFTMYSAMMILGFIGSKEEKLPNPKKIQVILNMPLLKNPQQIQIFLSYFFTNSLLYVFFCLVLHFQVLIRSYVASRALVYFPICSKCHFLNSTLASSSSLPIFFGSYSTSSSYIVALVLFSLAILSQSLVVCKVNTSTLLVVFPISFSPLPLKVSDPCDEFLEHSPQQPI